MRISDWSSDVFSSDLFAASGRGSGLQIVGNVAIFEFRAKRLFKPDDRTVLDQVDETLEIALEADRQEENGRTSAEAKIGRASGRERVWRDEEDMVGGG